MLKPDNEPAFNVEGIYKPGNIGMIYASVMQPFQYQIDEAKLSRVKPGSPPNGPGMNMESGRVEPIVASFVPASY